MNFLKIEWTKKRGVIALLATGLIVTSFVLGGYVATGSWNPWGHRHYYQNLDVNPGYNEYSAIGRDWQYVGLAKDLHFNSDPDSSTSLLGQLRYCEQCKQYPACRSVVHGG